MRKGGSKSAHAWIFFQLCMFNACRNEPPRDKTNKVACAPSEDSDQPGHPPRLIRVLAVRSVDSKSENNAAVTQRESSVITWYAMGMREKIPLIPFMRMQTYKYNFLETLNLNKVLKLTVKLSKMRSSFQNLDMF